MQTRLLNPTGQRPLRRAALCSALLALSTLTACGGGDAPEAAAPAPAPAPVPAPVPAPPPAPLPVPLITQGPPAEVVLEEAAGAVTPATLEVTASSPNGSALSYQWFLNDAACCSTAASLSVSPLPFEVTVRERTFRVEVSNSAGTARSSDVLVRQRQRQWTDLGSALATSEAAAVDGDSQAYVAHADARGRSHVASAVLPAGNGTVPRIAIQGVSRNADSDGWAYEQSLPLMDAASRASNLRMASTWMGYVFLAWSEYSASTERNVVRAALYTPATNPAEPGTWQVVGQASSTAVTSRAYGPSVVAVGADAFLVGWLQQPTGSAVTDAVALSYNVPAAGAELGSGWGTLVNIETVPENISDLQLVAGAPHVLAVFRRNGAAQNWHCAWRRSGTWDSAPQDLGISGATFARVDAAVGDAGQGVLAATDANGRVYVRRVDLAGAGFQENSWGYRANAYGSAPALQVGAEGRIDIVGVAVNTAAGNTSALGHWTYTAAAGWGSATVVLSNAGNFLQGQGLRQPALGRDDAGNLVLAVVDHG